ELLTDTGELLEHSRRLRPSGHALRVLRIEALALGRELRNGVVENACARAQLLELRPRRFELRLRLGVALLLQVRVVLRLLTRILELLDSRSRFGERRRDVFDLGGDRLRLHLEASDLLAPGDDADLRVVAAVDPQPMPSDPRAVRRDDRFAIGELAAKPNGLVERRHGADPCEERQRRRRPLDEIREPLLATLLRIATVPGLFE